MGKHDEGKKNKTKTHKVDRFKPSSEHSGSSGGEEGKSVVQKEETLPGNDDITSSGSVS